MTRAMLVEVLLGSSGSTTGMLLADGCGRSEPVLHEFTAMPALHGAAYLCMMAAGTERHVQ